MKRPKELTTPFQVDSATGQISVTDDPVRIIGQHIISVVATEPTERPMRPTYGVGLSAFLFESTDMLSVARDDVEDAVRTWEPRALIKDLDRIDRGESAIAFRLLYVVRDDPNMVVNTAVVEIGGGVTEVSRQ